MVFFLVMLSFVCLLFCLLVLSEGFDFLEFVVNYLFVDDESEFLFLVVERKFGDGFVYVSDYYEMKEF